MCHWGFPGNPSQPISRQRHPNMHIHAPACPDSPQQKSKYAYRGGSQWPDFSPRGIICHKQMHTVQRFIHIHFVRNRRSGPTGALYRLRPYAAHHRGRTGNARSSYQGGELHGMGDYHRFLHHDRLSHHQRSSLHLLHVVLPHHGDTDEALTKAINKCKYISSFIETGGTRNLFSISY
jgi:hypothetical protein